MGQKIDDGGPAFPFACQGPTTAPEFYYGMTLRDYFAAKAMRGLLSSPIGEHFFENWMGDEADEMEDGQNLCWSAYSIADAMIAERKRVRR